LQTSHINSIFAFNQNIIKMTIKLEKKETLSVVSRSTGLDSVGFYISKDSVDTSTNWTEYLQIGVSRLHQVFVLSYDGDVKVFVFERGQKVTREYFKHAEDGEIVFTNSKLYENDK